MSWGPAARDRPPARGLVADRLIVGPPHHDRRRPRRFARNRPVAGRVLAVDEEGREVGRVGKPRDLATERPDVEELARKSAVEGKGGSERGAFGGRGIIKEKNIR